MLIDNDCQKILQKLKPYVAMVSLQCGYAGMHVASAATLKDGMSQHVLVVYRNIVAAIIVAPFALWFERKERPRMTLLTFLKIIGLVLLQPVLDQNFYYMGVQMTSASFTSALNNINPSITFLLAVLLGVEKLNLRRRQSQAKVISVPVTIAGALVMILYKGPILQFYWAKGKEHYIVANGVTAQATVSFRWIKGTLMILVSCFSWSSFLILQSHTLETYPARLTLTTLICSMGAVINSVVAVIMEHGSSKPWIISWNKTLFAPIYSGVVCSGISYYILGMVMMMKGPVFAGAFSPVSMIMTAILGSIILAEKITLGMTIGAVVMVIGLYALLWDKWKDHLISSKVVSEAGEQKLPISAYAIQSIEIPTTSPQLLTEIPKMRVIVTLEHLGCETYHRLE